MIYTWMCYFIVINFIGYVLMGMDKARARKSKRRVPESRLFLIAWLGGALGVMLGMSRYRHKTLHSSFRLGIPLLLALNAAIAAFLFKLLLQ